MLACGNVSVGPRNGNVSRVGQSYPSPGNGPGLVEMSNVEDFEPIAIHHKGIAELNSDPAWIVELRSPDLRRDSGLQRAIQVYHHQTGVAKNVGVNAGDSHAASSGKLSLWIKG